jgi:hypothetical protein
VLLECRDEQRIQAPRMVGPRSTVTPARFVGARRVGVVLGAGVSPRSSVESLALLGCEPFIFETVQFLHQRTPFLAEVVSVV